MAFEGYLLAGISSSGNTTRFPAQYIVTESYNSTPNQREEIKAYRDDNTRDLTRITAIGRKSIISFDTIDGLNLKEKMQIQAFFKNCLVDTAISGEKFNLQRKIKLKFWDDENNKYKEGIFYLPDIVYTIDEYTHNDIIYKSIHFEFVEY